MQQFILYAYRVHIFEFVNLQLQVNLFLLYKYNTCLKTCVRGCTHRKVSIQINK